MATSRSDAQAQIDVRSDGTEFKIDGVGVTATADELNALADTGLSQAELDFLDGATAGTQVASKAVIADANVNTGVSKVTELHIGASGSETQVTATAAQINGSSPTIAAKGNLIVGSGAGASSALTVGADGTVPTANAGDTAGIGYAYPGAGLSQFYRASSTIKAANFDPLQATTAATMVDGTLYLQGVYLPHDATLTGVVFGQATQGDTTADNENRLGLYTSDGTNLTLVASCADDGTLWEGSTNTNISKDFASTYAAQAGRYWVGALANWSAVAVSPTLRAATALAASPMSTVRMTDTDEMVIAGVASQATLPASVAWSGVSVSVLRPWFGVY